MGKTGQKLITATTTSSSNNPNSKQLNQILIQKNAQQKVIMVAKTPVSLNLLIG